MYAFRCVNCGHLEGAEHAGECHVPHACRVCGRGVVFGRTPQEVLTHEHCHGHRDKLTALHESGHLTKHFTSGGRCVPLPAPLGYKFLIHENWELLADATDARLAELGLTRAEVCSHKPTKFAASRNESESKLIVTGMTDGVVTTDGAS